MELLFFVLEIGLGVVAIACLLRFLFQLSRVNPLNIVVASTRRLTDSFLNPLRAFLPANRRIDTASLFVAWLAMSGRVGIQISHAVAQSDLFQYSNATTYLIACLGGSLIRLLQYTVWIFIAAIIVTVILSWVAPHSTSPYAHIAREIPSILLRPIQGLLPTLGTLDFSPAIVLLLLFAINSRVIPWLNSLVF